MLSVRFDNDQTKFELLMKLTGQGEEQKICWNARIISFSLRSGEVKLNQMLCTNYIYLQCCCDTIGATGAGTVVVTGATAVCGTTVATGVALGGADAVGGVAAETNVAPGGGDGVAIGSPFKLAGKVFGKATPCNRFRIRCIAMENSNWSILPSPLMSARFLPARNHIWM